mgnify:FL=1
MDVDWYHQSYQRHFLWTIEGPFYSYSASVINIVLADDIYANIDPPIHAETYRWLSAKTSTFTSFGANALTSLLNLFCRLLNIVFPPLKTMFWYNYFLRPASVFEIEETTNWWIPCFYWLIRLGLKRASGHLNLSLSTLITLWSGSSYKESPLKSKYLMKYCCFMIHNH